MKIAILMSTFNGQDYLDEQLESLYNQTIKDNIVVYIRDDGSSDDTLNIIQRWSKKMNIVLYKGENSGPALSFWMLFMDSNIQADFYAFCDQDDIWDSDKVEVAVNSLKLNEEADLYACNCRIIDEFGEIINKKRIVSELDPCIEKLFVSGCTQGCSMVFTDKLRCVVKKMKLQCIPMHDIVLMLHAVCMGKIIWDSVPHFSYRVHSKNVVAKGNKTFYQKINTTINNWKNSSKNSMSDVANELLKNNNHLTKADREYLMCISSYKVSFNKKLKIMFNKRIRRLPKRLLNSYRFRILFNLY